MYLVNDKGQSMTCGLYSGLGEGQASGEKVEAGSEVPYRSISISVQIVDLVAEVSLTYKFLNAGDKPIQPTFLFPLNDSGVLCDVEVMVDAERRIASDVDPEATKRILEQKETFKGDEQEVHVVRAGEVPVNSEITIKCTYVAIFNIVGGAVKFILPSHLIPTRQHEQDGAKDPLRVSVSMEMHDMVQEVVSESHPESVASCATFVGGKATAEILVGAGGLSTDLVLLIRVKDPMAPRAWTSVGLSGGIPSRMSMFVLSPPFHENDGGLSKEGEVILFLDVREDNKADMAQILRASLEKLPRWAYFNVWASFDGASVAPVFEQAVAATDQGFQDAIAKFNTRVPFSGDESTLLTSVQTLLSQPISFPPRILFFVTSMGAHVDEALKVIASTSATTRNVVVLLNSKWNKAYLPQLLTLNGGSVVRSNTQELETLLPKLIEQTVQPTQSLSFTSTPNPTYQFPVSVPPLFLGSSYTFFMTSYDRLSPSEEVTITLGLDENGAAVKAKHVNSQTLHRLGSHALLSELNAGTRKDLTPHQKDTIATVLYSPWIFQPTTPKERHLVQTFSEPSLSAKNKQDSSSISSMITAFRSGKTDFPGVTSKPSALTMPSKRQSTPSLTDGGAKGNLSLREKRLQMHKSASKVFDMCASDYADRTKISLAELEPHSLDIGINFIKETVSPARQLTATDATSLRSIILPIIEGAKDKEFCSEGIVDVTKLKPLIHDAVKEKWSAESDAAFWYEVSNTAEKGARPHMEDQNCVVDAANDLYGLSNQPRMAFFGVFDGHSGKLAAEYTKTHLPYNVLRHAAFDATKLGSEDDAGVRTAFTEGYLKTDADFMAIAEKDSLKAGTTAVTLLLLDEYMVISNVGDSEAVVCRDGKAVQLSTLHTPTNEKEKQRVAAAGGAIVHYGTWRVNGVLAVTRSIGDRTLKEQVTAHPDTAIEKITDKDEFIILATDGVWEAVSHQEAVDLVRKEREKEREKKEGEQEDTRSISRRLVDEAVRKESKDNITAVVIFFKHK